MEAEKKFKNELILKQNLPLVSFVALVLVAPFLVFIWGSYQNYLLEIEKVRLTTQSFSYAVERYTADVLESSDNILQSILTLKGDSFKGNSVDARQLSQDLADIVKRQRFIELIATTDATGTYTANSTWIDNFDQLYATRKSLAQRQSFLNARDNPASGLVISDPVASLSTGRLVLSLSRRLPSKNGKFNGIIVLAINLKKFSDFFSQITQTSTDAITLWTEKRLLLARYPYSESQIGKYVEMSPSMVPLVKEGLKLGTYQGKSTVDNVMRIFTFRMVEGFPFHVVVGISSEQVLAAWRKTVLWTGLSGAFLFMLVAYLLNLYLRKLRESEHQKITMLQTSKMASLGIMASGIAHEINNPLAIISGRAHQIVRSIEQGTHDIEVIKTLAAKIESTTFRISKIISGLKSFARDSSTDEMQPARLSDIIENTVELCVTRFDVKGVKLERLGATDVQVLCRDAELSQVILNFLNNAFDAVMALDDKWVKVEVTSDGTSAEISVTDSGNGIPAEVVEKMTLPFYTTKPVGHGTGLGLSISKGIIESHGGKFWYDSNSKNTRFVIRLPIYIAETAPAFAEKKIAS